MKKLGFFLSLICATFVTMMASAATATFDGGKLTLNFIGDYATIEPGNGNIIIVNGEGLQLASVIGEPEYDFTLTQDYQVLVYSVAGRLDAGDYTVKIADGAILGDKTDPWAFGCPSIGALDLPLTVGEGEGGADSATPEFKEPTIELIAGAGTNVKYTYPNSFEPENYNKYGAEGKNATLYEDGVEVATSTFGFQMDPTYFYGVHFDYEVTAGKNYKVTFAAGCWYVEYADEQGNSEVVLESPEVSYTWVGGEETGSVVNPDDQPGEGSGDEPGNEQSSSDISVDFKVPASLVAITNNMVVANVTVDRPYYAIYWEVRCATDPEFYFGGMASASAGAGTYTIIAMTPSAEPVELNSGNVYTFSFSSCEFGWDAAALIASFDVNGAGAAAEQFSDIVITEFDGTLGALGYNYKKKYNFTFSAPVTDVKAFTPLGMDGTSNFPVSAADSEGLKWTVDVSSMANEEGGFELHIQATDPASGLRLRGTYNLDHSFIYTISLSASDPDDGGEEPELPSEELDIATITIDGTVYHLSEKTAIELDSYPEDAIFTITLADEAIKKVSYEIIDHTTDEILKSVADLEKGENGEWTATMPRTYDMVAGHVYYVHVVAFDGMSSFTSNVLHEYNFLVNGTKTDVAVYSTVKVASIDPSENTIITEAAPVITITFTEAIASLSVTAILGQMASATIPAENVTTSDNIAWTVAVPMGMIVDGSLSLTFVAIDNEGNRVTDADNGVGLPENCYLHYGWASTVGLPTPALTEDGTTVNAIDALHFTYEGIGLNQDNNTATWNQISIALNGVAINLAITEDMFSISGDASVGGTELVLTLPNALTEAGVYTIHVPAFAFMLGHEQANFYSGECDFTVTVSGASGLNGIAADPSEAIYQLNGTQAGHITNGFYIVNGHKVIIK